MNLAKPNYRAWAVRVDDFPYQGSLSQQLVFLLNFAVLAPSTHNSQPWKFSVSGNTISVLPNFERALPASDPENKFLYFSLGCATENILTAARAYGFNTQLVYGSGENAGIHINLTRETSRRPQPDDLIFQIPQRYTSRHRFGELAVPTKFLQWLKDTNTPEVEAMVVVEPSTMAQVVALVDEYTPLVMSAEGFRKELAGLVHSNITSAKTGMPAFVMGVPTLISIPLPFIMRHFNLTKFQKKKQESALYTPSFVIISTKEESVPHWVQAGMCYQAIGLKATDFGLGTHPLAAPLHGGGAERLRAVIKTVYHPQFLFRLGFPTTPILHTPRIPSEECIVKN